MTTVRQLLDDKGCAFWSTEPSRSIDEAIATMAERDIGALLVIDDRSGNLLGIITERRCARLAQNGKTTANGRVRDFVDPAIPTVGLSDSIESCLTRLAGDSRSLSGCPLPRPSDRRAGAGRPAQNHHPRPTVHHPCVGELHPRSACGVVTRRSNWRLGQGMPLGVGYLTLK